MRPLAVRRTRRSGGARAGARPVAGVFLGRAGLAPVVRDADRPRSGRPRAGMGSPPASPTTSPPSNPSAARSSDPRLNGGGGASGLGGSGSVRAELRAMKVLEGMALRDREAPSRVMFGPHETNLGWDGRSSAPRGLLRAPGGGRRRRRGGRGGVGHALGLALRAVPRRRVRARLGRDRRRRPRPAAWRWPPRPQGGGDRRRTASSVAGAERRPRGEPRDAQVMGTTTSTVVGPAGGGAGAAATGRGQRQPEQPGAPVPVRPDEPPRRRVRQDRLRFAREVLHAVRSGAAGHRGPPAVVRRAGSVGRHRAQRRQIASTWPPG